MARKFRNKRMEKDLAREQIRNYFAQADESYMKNPGLANRYVTLARKTAMKYQVRIPPELKRKFCKHCYKYLRPGKNVLIRTAPRGGGRVIYECLSCKKHMRFPYVKEKKLKREATKNVKK